MFIWWGAKKTRRHEQVEQRLRTALALEKPKINVSDAEPSTPLSAIPESGSGTAGSTPTLAVKGSPQPKDFIEPADSEKLRSGETQRREEYTRKMSRISEHHEKSESESEQNSFIGRRGRKASTGSSLASVPIADHMTVPAAEDIYPISKSQ